MGRPKDGDNIKSNLIISEVQKRPCLYDTSNSYYIDRSTKARCWEEVCTSVVPGWCLLSPEQKFAAGKEVQKRWRSIRDSYTKAYRQGKCVLPELCQPNSRRYAHHSQMAFLLKVLQNKKHRYSLDKYESEVSSSPKHLFDDCQMKIKADPDKPKEPVDKRTPFPDKENKDKMVVKDNIVYEKNTFEKFDDSQIVPEDNLDDDKLFMHSLVPFFKKMSDDTKLLCRIEVLKIIRHALQDRSVIDQSKKNGESLVTQRNVKRKDHNDAVKTPPSNTSESTLSMVTRSADGSRIRKRRTRTPSPLPPSPPQKRRGPGRPRKVRPPTPVEIDVSKKKLARKTKSLPDVEPRLTEYDNEINRATRVEQLGQPEFMKLYNLERAKNTSNGDIPFNASVKTEPIDIDQTS